MNGKEMVERMEPFLLSCGVGTKQIERAHKAEEVETHLWIKNIFDTVFLDLWKVYCRHDKIVWKRLEDMGGLKFEEVRQYKLCLKHLRKAWFEKRPYEISKKCGTRRNHGKSEAGEVGTPQSSKAAR